MSNNPIVEILAKERSELTDKIAKELIMNFGSYNSGPYMKLINMENEYWDGHRALTTWTPNDEKEVLAKVYGNEVFPVNILELNMTKYMYIHGKARFASIHVFKDFNPDEPSVSPKFPYSFVSFSLDSIGNDSEETARVACGLPLELIKLDRLQLSAKQQNQFRIVAYWEGLGRVSFNHFKYDAFKKLGIEGLTKAFLYANERANNSLKNLLNDSFFRTF